MIFQKKNFKRDLNFAYTHFFSSKMLTFKQPKLQLIAMVIKL